jgi:hypothetical protein
MIESCVRQCEERKKVKVKGIIQSASSVEDFHVTGEKSLRSPVTGMGYPWLFYPLNT